MKIRRAVEIARSWVEQEASSIPGFRAAHLSGSLSQVSPDDEVPDHSDIDVYCVVDDGLSLPQRKLGWQGALLEAVFFPLSAYSSPEEVLSNPYLAHDFLSDSILSDSARLLGPIHRRVMREFAYPRWRQARYVRAKQPVLDVAADAGQAATLNEAFPLLFRSVRLLSNLVLVAHLRPPTVRACLIRARDLLQQGGHAPLAVDLAALLGSSSLTAEQARASLQACVRAFDRAAEVYRTAFVPGFNLAPAARPYLAQGAEEMIEACDHREAMLWIAAMHWTANRALQNDAPEPERAEWQASMDALYALLGLSDLDDFRRRMQRVQGVSSRLVALLDAVVLGQRGVGTVESTV